MVDGRDWLIDDRPRLADFAVMSQLVYLKRTPVGETAIAQRPAIAAFLDRMRALRAVADAHVATATPVS